MSVPVQAAGTSWRQISHPAKSIHSATAPLALASARAAGRAGLADAAVGQSNVDYLLERLSDAFGVSKPHWPGPKPRKTA